MNVYSEILMFLHCVYCVDGSHRMDTINIDELVAWTEALDEKELENVTVS